MRINDELCPNIDFIIIIVKIQVQPKSANSGGDQKILLRDTSGIISKHWCCIRKNNRDKMDKELRAMLKH